MTLTIDNLSKRYGSTVALDGVSFEVQPGELFGFVGSNGAGKTTTMRIALGVLAADGGEVRLSGKPVDLDVRRTIGYMPEERGLYPKMKVGNQLILLGCTGFRSAMPRRRCSAGPKGWASPSGSVTRSIHCLSAISSAFSSPQRSYTIPPSSFSTNRSRVSIRSPSMS